MKVLHIAVMFVCVLFFKAIAHAHGDVMRIGSAQPGGGQLQIESEFDFHLPVYLTELTTIGDQTLYQAIIPSFSWILGVNEAGLVPVTAGTRVTFVLQSVTPSASVRIGGRLLDASGESAILGTFSSDPETHIHPEWQLILPIGETGEFTLSFSLQEGAVFRESPTYTLTLTNVAPPPTPTATETTLATATPTSTSTAPVEPTRSPAATASPTATPLRSCAGDCNDDGFVTVDEIVRAVILALGDPGAAPCPAADTSGDAAVTVDEIVGAIDSALRGCAIANVV